MRSFLVLLLSAVLLLGHALPAAGPVAASESFSAMRASLMEQGGMENASAGHQSMDRAAMMRCCALADPGDDALAGHCLADCVFVLPLLVLRFERRPAPDIFTPLHQGTAFAPPLALRPPIA